MMNKSEVVTAFVKPSASRDRDEVQAPGAALPAGLVEITDEELDGIAGGGMNPTIRYGAYWPGCG